MLPILEWLPKQQWISCISNCFWEGCEGQLKAARSVEGRQPSKYILFMVFHCEEVVKFTSILVDFYALPKSIGNITGSAVWKICGLFHHTKYKWINTQIHTWITQWSGLAHGKKWAWQQRLWGKRELSYLPHGGMLCGASLASEVLCQV